MIFWGIKVMTQHLARRTDRRHSTELPSAIGSLRDVPMFRFVIGLLVCALLPSAALANKRVALVIGNSAYENTPILTNPRNDANDMAAAMQALGFKVIEGFDLNKVSFEQKIRDFAQAMSGASVGVFFYAGHGLQVAGQNYLVPIDAKLTTAAALDWEMVRLDLVQRTMERETETNVIFLDACRDNPLARNLARAMGTRSAEIGQGLAATEAGVGTLISFSTQPGNVALDGVGRNSPFAGALVRRIGASSDDLSALLIDVRNDVRKETQNKQVPWEHSALTGRFYFKPVDGAGPSATVTPTVLSEAAEVWDRTKDSRDIATLEAFAARYKDTFYAQLAKVRAERLLVVAVPPLTGPPTPAFDGAWEIHRTSENCISRNQKFVAQISKGNLTSDYGAGRTVSGTVDDDGNIKFNHAWLDRDGKPDGILWVYSGTLRGNSGGGSFVKNAQCDGHFTATRAVVTREMINKHFDGQWEISATSEKCQRKSWTNRVIVRESQILGGNFNGQVAEGGDFHFTLPSSTDKKVLGIFTGKFKGDAGAGIYKYPGCTGSITLKRL